LEILHNKLGTTLVRLRAVLLELCHAQNPSTLFSLAFPQNHTSGMSLGPKEVVGKDDLMHFQDASPKQKIAIGVEPQLRNMKLIGTLDEDLNDKFIKPGSTMVESSQFNSSNYLLISISN
jgi:hypothetical protein